MTSRTGRPRTATPRPEDATPAAIIAKQPDISETDAIITRAASKHNDDMPELAMTISEKISHTAKHQRRLEKGFLELLAYLNDFPGETWHERALLSGGMEALWAHARLNGVGTYPTRTAFAGLVVAGYLRVDYEFLFNSPNQLAQSITPAVRSWHPDEFNALLPASLESTNSRESIRRAQKALAQLCVVTGRSPLELTLDDIREHGRVAKSQSEPYRHLVPEFLYKRMVTRGQFGPDAPASRTLLTNPPRRTIEEHLNFTYADLLQETPTVSDFFSLYLHRKQSEGLDWATVSHLLTNLVGIWWGAVQEVSPGLDSLNLPPEVWDGTAARLRFTSHRNRSLAEQTVRRNQTVQKQIVVSMFDDVRLWAIAEPDIWSQFIFHCPWGMTTALGRRKESLRQETRMKSRTRIQMEVAPDIVKHLQQEFMDARAFLDEAVRHERGEEFEHVGATWKRVDRSRTPSLDSPGRLTGRTMISVMGSDGGRIQISTRVERTFWAWATAEFLLHTGLRIEEACEISEDNLVRLTMQGQRVVGITIRPSKLDSARVIILSEEAFLILGKIVSFVKSQNDGIVPSIPRYDKHEQEHLSAEPWVFQNRRWGAPTAITPDYIRYALNESYDRLGLEGEHRFTPHDFRRCFVSLTVNAGLPIQYAQLLCGHRTIRTTERYFAHDEEKAFAAFLDASRAVRGGVDARVKEADQVDVETYLGRRQVELGRCDRGLGRECERNHACVSCPALRLRDDADERLHELEADVQARKARAKEQGWLGELAGLSNEDAAIQRHLRTLERRRELRLQDPAVDESAFRPLPPLP